VKARCVGFLRSKWLPALVGVAMLTGGGVAMASHVPQLDPATVPTGFLAAHNSVANIRVSAVARAVKGGRADVFVQHVRLDANAPTGWHTHPGPAIVTVVKGTLTYEDAKAGGCHRATYTAGQGFFDRGFGHVHRAVAGPAGADFYVTYILPSGSSTHIIPASPPSECDS
jgi:quercetin dioxygenase-like cupin family protein